VAARQHGARGAAGARAGLLPMPSLAATGCALAAALASGAAQAHAIALDETPGIEQAPVWLAQSLFLLAWLSFAWGAWLRPPPTGPRVAFHSAMGVAALALFGPLDTLAVQSSAWHMVQHMLLIVVVAPLAVLGRPMPQWRALLGSGCDVLWRHLHRFSRHPMRCALLHAAAIWFWHAPGPYIAAVQNPLWHVLEHACFLFSGWLLWWAVLRPGRAGVLPAALALLFTVMHTGLLGALLSFASVPLYHGGPGALADQQLAGLVMWVPGGLVYLLAAVWATGRWLLTLERDAVRSTGTGAGRAVHA
jgi:cytochrome c oxidase assembly factor CtaG